MEELIVLHYIGAGAYVPGVPATDLTQTQIDASGHTAAELLQFSPAIYEPVEEGNNNGNNRTKARAVRA